MFTVTVTENTASPEDHYETTRYTQRVDTLDLHAVIAAVNKKPRATRKDAGKPRKQTDAE